MTPVESLCAPNTDFTAVKGSLYLHLRAVSGRVRKPYSRCPHFLLSKTWDLSKGKSGNRNRAFQAGPILAGGSFQTQALQCNRLHWTCNISV